ncbi:MAG: hypothetical protein QOH67_3060 [Hyphomicrobiales bacterium]|nr:hypothetical protein [Hyphomicrobiales bacterium]
MYSEFKYETLPLKDILLDDRNPRLVTQTKLSTQKDILSYLYEHEELDDFVHKIAREGRNQGGERPYVVKFGPNYVVIEGNTRIAAYKLLTGLLTPPNGYSVPHVAPATLASLANVDCTIAPNRDALMPIMASAHFGLGDKSRWKYLGSRKIIYDEWKAGWTLPRLSKVFNVTQSEVKDLILEYMLYQKALSFGWTQDEKARLLDPAVAFNPPVRFLQTSGHKEKMGITYDSANLEVLFAAEANKKFKHLLKKLVIAPVKGLGATASYDAVFADYGASGKGKTTSTSGSGSAGNKSSKTSGGAGGGKSGTKGAGKKPNALFAYQPTMTNALVVQLMKEARDIDAKKFPASATFLLRNIVESVLKHIIDVQKANKTGASLDLEGSLNLCRSNHVILHVNDKKIIKQFQQDHLSYLNLGAHGNVIPNPDRVAAARDCIDQFIKKHV